MLKGPRLTLRAITRDDLPRYVSWLNDPEVTKYLTTYAIFNLEDEADWYESQRKDNTSQNFAIETEKGNHIGSIGLNGIDHRLQFAELGIVIGDKNEWGKGYGGEAVNILLAHAFNTLNLNRVSLRVDADHTGGIKCYERCGFIKEGELRQAVFRDGQLFNQYIMSVLRQEYRQG